MSVSHSLNLLIPGIKKSKHRWRKVMKKKLLTGALALSIATGLVACDFAEGVDHDFGSNAFQIFTEIDEDTMEYEVSDRDDLDNLYLLNVEAESEREKEVVKGIKELTNLQANVVTGDATALHKYLDVREDVIEAAGFEGWHSVPKFQFTE